MKNIVLLGSTGSIGQQVLDVLRVNRDKFRLIGISGKSKISLLKQQVEEFEVMHVSFGDEKSLVELATLSEADLIVNALSGSIGIAPTFAALHTGKNVALANKESLVSAGEVLMDEARKNNAKIIPIDSELSSLHQMLDGKPTRDIEKIIITASGGPFFGKTREELKHVTVEDALKHPTWRMGQKVTIDSATLMNKALEIIEAFYLFGISEDQIEVIVQPESIVHAFVQFRDGNIMAVMSPTDMRFAIHYALFYPERMPNNLRRLDFSALPQNSLHFAKPDFSLFQGPLLAREVLKKGGDAPRLLNEANEIAVRKFLNREIGFLEIYPTVQNFLHSPYSKFHIPNSIP